MQVTFVATTHTLPDGRFLGVVLCKVDGVEKKYNSIGEPTTDEEEAYALAKKWVDNVVDLATTKFKDAPPPTPRKNATRP